MLYIVFFMFICSSFSCFGSHFPLEHDTTRSRNVSLPVFCRESGLSIPETIYVPSNVNVTKARYYIDFRDAQSFYRGTDLVVEVHSQQPYQSAEEDIRDVVSIINNNRFLQRCTVRSTILVGSEIRRYEASVGGRIL